MATILLVRDDRADQPDVVEQKPLAGVLDRAGQRIPADRRDAVGVLPGVLGEFLDDAVAWVVAVGDVSGEMRRRQPNRRP